MESQDQNISETQITEIQHKLSKILQNYELKQKIKINQKLYHLCQKTIPQANNKASNEYINQSHIKLTEIQQEFFNFDPNCHLSIKYDLNIKTNKSKLKYYITNTRPTK